VPVDRLSSTLTSYPAARKARTTCDPMKPAPPLMSARRAMSAVLAVLRGCRRDASVSVRLVEREEVAERVHDGETAPVGGCGAQAHAGVVEKLVHECPGKMLDGVLVLGRKVPELPQGVSKLRLAHLLHLRTKQLQHRHGREARKPLPVLLDLGRDDRLSSGKLVAPALEIRRDNRLQIIEIIEKHIVQRADVGHDIAWNGNVHDAERRVTAC